MLLSLHAPFSLLLHDLSDFLVAQPFPDVSEHFLEAFHAEYRCQVSAEAEEPQHDEGEGVWGALDVGEERADYLCFVHWLLCGNDNECDMFRFILIVGMWAARMLRTAATFKPMMTLTNPARNYCASIKPSVK
jgi:hypothetical protein